MTRTALLDAVEPPLIAPEKLAADPHGMFRQLRPETPVIRLAEKHYMALRAADVIGLLTDPATRQIEGHEYVGVNEVPDGAAARFMRDVFLFANGKEHRAGRSLFARPFSLGRIRAQQGKIRAVADAIAADLPRDEPFDFVSRMAARVPAEMIARLLGLKVEDAPYFSGRVYALAQAFTPVYPRERHHEINQAAGDLFDYVEEQLADRFTAPQDDLLTALVASWRSDPAISFESLVHQVVGMIIGGVDTTRAGFAMLVALLLQHPAQWEAVKRDASLIPGAVLEALRYEPSVGSVARITIAPVKLGGVAIPAGELLRVSTMSAMRDPGLYADPDRFDIRRTDHPRLHTVFGHGPHRCIGEMLARFEMEEALAALIAQAPDIDLIAPPRMLGFGGLRQITPMMVRI